MLFCQFAKSQSVRDISNGLRSATGNLNHLGIQKAPSKSSVSYQNKHRSYNIFKSYYFILLESLGQQAGFMDATFSGRLNEDKIKAIRDQWKGKLVLKGVASEVDAQEAIRLGIDGIIVSNHGGRQLDSGESSIKPLTRIAEKFGNQIEVMMDSGIRSGSDVARAIASGAKFAFMGRSFMYGAAALGNNGGNHTITLLKKELNQIMEQLCCERLEDLPNHLIRK